MMQPPVKISAVRASTYWPVTVSLPPAAIDTVLANPITAANAIARFMAQNLNSHYRATNGIAGLAIGGRAKSQTLINQCLQQPRSPVHWWTLAGCPSGPKPVWVWAHQYQVPS